MAQWLYKQRNVSIRTACVCAGISESCYRYNAKLCDENAVIADWLLRLTQTHKRWGFGLCYFYLRNVKLYGWNHKRVYRIYRELELNLRIKPKRRIKRDRPDPLGTRYQVSVSFVVLIKSSNGVASHQPSEQTTVQKISLKGL